VPDSSDFVVADFVSVSIPCAGPGEATQIADRLVADRLAACVHLSSIASTYEWQGTVQHDDEVLVVAATHRDRLADLVETVRSVHSYELPAISWVPLGGSPDYLAWVRQQVQMRSK
jgi:periplasmic divalent cation tolerance protein